MVDNGQVKTKLLLTSGGKVAIGLDSQDGGITKGSLVDELHGLSKQTLSP
jgi:hypothetical protein